MHAVRWIIVGLVLAALGATGATARAEAPEACYTLDSTVLTGPAGADLTVHVATAVGCTAPSELKKLQVKTFAGDKLDDVRNLTDVALESGSATIELGQLARASRVESEALIHADATNRTWQARTQTNALLRPDLTVSALRAPAQTLTVRPVDVEAEIAELNGDVGATATVTLSWGPSVLRTQRVDFPKGARVPVTFGAVALTTPAAAELTVRVSEVVPDETDATNNVRSTTVDVTEFELARSRLILDSLGGYGAQFNQHVYAKLTPAPPGSLPGLEEKVKALEPQLVRIFFHEIDELDPDKMASFVETVELAHQAGASINITYTTATRAKFQPALFMGQFAAILENLVRTRGFTNVRWVTIQNEPNSTLVTLAQYEALNRAIHAQLVTRGLRDQIGIMAGDLVESGGGGHRVWMKYIAEHMSDIVDAYSEHIYWNYWDIPRMEFRLRDVRQLMMEELPASARKPVYIMEFGTRGAAACGTQPTLAPGYWEGDCTQITRTNVAAFQQLWFNIASAQLGYSGTSKWDAFWGKYNSANQAFWMIGPAEEGWPLFPTYHAFRMLLQTTARGWHVVGVDPWGDDDWKVGVADQPEKEIAAYAGPAGELTFVGLDTRAQYLNVASPETPAYSIGGLPPFTTFNLAIWNKTANGENVVSEPVKTNEAGVARFEVPLHGAFALTTVPVS
jgi:hypothetical protein